MGILLNTYSMLSSGFRLHHWCRRGSCKRRETAGNVCIGKIILSSCLLAIWMLMIC